MGNPPYEDDASILDTATLWRRINPEWWVLDAGSDKRRLSTAAFDNAKDENKKDTNEMSVALADEIGDPKSFLGTHDGYGIAAFAAGLARQNCKQTVVRAPEDGQPWHAHVVGNKTKSVKKTLRDNSQMVVEPTSK